MKYVFTPSPKFAVTGPTATFSGPRMYSLRSIHWYPSQPQYASRRPFTDYTSRVRASTMSHLAPPRTISRILHAVDM